MRIKNGVSGELVFERNRAQGVERWRMFSQTRASMKGVFVKTCTGLTSSIQSIVAP